MDEELRAAVISLADNKEDGYSGYSWKDAFYVPYCMLVQAASLYQDGRFDVSVSVLPHL